MERLFQKYEREEKAKEKVKLAEKSRKRMMMANSNEDKQLHSAKIDHEESFDKSVEQILGKGLELFKTVGDYKAQIEGATLLLGVLLERRQDSEKRKSYRKQIWNDIKKELVFRSSKAFLLQTLESLDAVEAVVRRIRKSVATDINDGLTVDSSKDLRDKINALRMCEIRLETAQDGRIRLTSPEIVDRILENKTRNHVLAGSIITLRRIPPGILPEEEAYVTLSISDLKPGVRKEDIVQYFRQYCEVAEKDVELPLPRYNSFLYTLHTRCRQLLDLVEGANRSADDEDETSRECVKMRKLLKEQDLEYFFLAKLQAEVILQAKKLHDDDSTIETKSQFMRESGSRYDASEENEKGFQDHQCSFCGVPILQYLCAGFSDAAAFEMIRELFKVAMLLFLCLRLLACISSVVTLVIANLSPADAFDSLDTFAAMAVYVCGLLVLFGTVEAFAGMSLDIFGRHHPAKLFVFLDFLVFNVLFVASAILFESSNDKVRGGNQMYKSKFDFVALSAVYHSVSLVVYVFRHADQIVIHTGSLCSCAWTPRFCGHGWLRFKMHVLGSKCSILSLSTIVRTFRCVSCIIPSRCRWKSLLACDCYSRYWACFDAVEDVYVHGKEGTQRLKQDLENQCSTLLETMKKEDMTAHDPALHHYANRMRWRIQRLKQLVTHRRNVEERQKYHPENMVNQKTCFTCRKRFNNWIVPQTFCKRCGYSFCPSCVGNIRPLPNQGYAHANVCSQCAMSIDLSEASKESF